MKTVIDRDTYERILCLTKKETEELEKNGFLYDKEEEHIIIKQDGQYVWAKPNVGIDGLLLNCDD